MSKKKYSLQKETVMLVADMRCGIYFRKVTSTLYRDG